jgi:hypothetical protein
MRINTYLIPNNTILKIYKLFINKRFINLFLQSATIGTVYACLSIGKGDEVSSL